MPVAIGARDGVSANTPGSYCCIREGGAGEGGSWESGSATTAGGGICAIGAWCPILPAVHSASIVRSAESSAVARPARRVTGASWDASASRWTVTAAQSAAISLRYACAMAEKAAGLLTNLTWWQHGQRTARPAAPRTGVSILYSVAHFEQTISIGESLQLVMPRRYRDFVNELETITARR